MFSKIILSVGTFLGLLFSCSLVYSSFTGAGAIWMIVGIIYLAAMLCCLYGLWRHRLQALFLSRMLMLMPLGLGGYLVCFAWNFWMFNSPTLGQRFRAVFIFNPEGVILIVPAVLWLAVTFIPKFKSEFK